MSITFFLTSLWEKRILLMFIGKVHTFSLFYFIYGNRLTDNFWMRILKF
ncbi:conserved hypothetical protein [delta proteobacterium NaphS2]|nr:conserved hypothetical protein [delta proteobacterium NaphS2]